MADAYVCGACNRIVPWDASGPHNERYHGEHPEPRTYASLPVETRRRVVERCIYLHHRARRKERLSGGSRIMLDLAKRLYAAARRLESYIVGEKA